MSGPTSFSVLDAEHERLAETFLSHQEALLRLDTLGALERLVEFEADLLDHMRLEEEVLLPAWERFGPRAPWSPSVFVGEHRRMRRMISTTKDALRTLAGDASSIRRGVLRILDAEALFKRLVEHHNERERRALYPALDRIPDEVARREIWRRCATPRDASRASTSRRRPDDVDR